MNDEQKQAKGGINYQASGMRLISFYVSEQYEQHTIKQVQKWSSELKGFGNGYYQVTILPEYDFFRCVSRIKALLEGQDISGWDAPIPLE